MADTETTPKTTRPKPFGLKREQSYLYITSPGHHPVHANSDGSPRRCGVFYLPVPQSFVKACADVGLKRMSDVDRELSRHIGFADQAPDDASADYVDLTDFFNAAIENMEASFATRAAEIAEAQEAVDALKTERTLYAKQLPLMAKICGAETTENGRVATDDNKQFIFPNADDRKKYMAMSTEQRKSINRLDKEIAELTK